MSIKQLPQDAIDKIKSSVAVTSLNGVITCLLKNSLDASATKIYVSCDYAKGDCSVEDNGRGIPSPEFYETGGLGKLHHTSRFPPSSGVHGRRGDFLAALAGLSLLSITSKHPDYGSQNALTFHDGKVLSRKLSASAEESALTFRAGTHVSVRNLFGSMPVRVRQRADAGNELGTKSKTWSELVRNTVALLLPWCGEVMIILRDKQVGREVRLQAPQTHCLVSRTSTLLMQADLADSYDDTSWVRVSSSSRQVSVSGCISLNAVPHRRSQFLSLGIQPVENTYGTNLLYEVVQKTFRNSSFGVNEDQAWSTRAGRLMSDSQLRRGPDQHPMFSLRIDMEVVNADPTSEDSLYTSRTQPQLELVADLLRAVCYGFLKSHHFRPQKETKRSSELPFPTTRKLGGSARRLERSGSSSSITRSGTSVLPGIERSSSPFDSWNRVKVGAATTRPKTTEPTAFSKERLIGVGGTVLRRPFQDPDSDTEGNDRTMTSRQPSELQFTTGPNPCVPKHPGVSGPCKVKRNCSDGWLAQIIRNWDNPIFENVERSVQTVCSDALGEQSHHWRGSGEDVYLNPLSMTMRRRLHKKALQDAEIISQVDRKFILARLPLTSISGEEDSLSTTLIMFDQHAIDERCQLEELMTGYFRQDAGGFFVAESEALGKAVALETTRQETELLRLYQRHFQDWGIHYSVQAARPPVATEAPSNGGIIRVDSLPPSIKERCRTEPKLLVDVLRHEIWRLNDGGVASRPSITPNDDSQHPWVGLFRGCPPSILDLLHSRSCRSAIMFNDELSKTDCEHLIDRLSRCAFPFQCAHGRPSVAPILDLGTEPWHGAWSEQQPTESRVASWKDYMGC